MSDLAPRYPIYIPSKGRSDALLAARMFDADAVPYHVVVEPQEAEAYAAVVGGERVLCLPESGRGLVYSRTWIKRHSVERGEARHWQFDDDVTQMMRLHLNHRLPCDAAIALRAAEDFVDRYENVALPSFNSEFFLPTTGAFSQKWPPFFLNFRCYTCFLMLNAIPNEWRGRYNEDTDMTLQVLADGWCTILFNAFCMRTPATMTHRGGQTDIYEGDGRREMARELERRWPRVVSVKRKFGRPQHHVDWKKFDTPLRPKPGVVIPDGDPYGLALAAKREVRSAALRELLERSQ